MPYSLCLNSGPKVCLISFRNESCPSNILLNNFTEYPRLGRDLIDPRTIIRRPEDFFSHALFLSAWTTIMWTWQLCDYCRYKICQSVRLAISLPLTPLSVISGTSLFLLRSRIEGVVRAPHDDTAELRSRTRTEGVVCGSVSFAKRGVIEHLRDTD